MPTTPDRPQPRRGRALLALGLGGLLAVAAAVALDLGALPGEERRVDGGYRGSEPPARIELPAFELLSYRGNQVASDELRGSVVVLTLLDSQCTESCPVIAWTVARAVDRLTQSERQEVRALAVSGDPVEDTPTSVRRFLGTQRAEGRLDWLIGSERELRPLWDALQLLPSLDTGEDSLHSAPVRIYDRRSIWVATQHAQADLSEENLVYDVQRALDARFGNDSK
jgi:cytochrome oxidase Cu insertion factor (SCO1/SenC/PrrC family)